MLPAFDQSPMPDAATPTTSNFFIIDIRAYYKKDNSGVEMHYKIMVGLTNNILKSSYNTDIPNIKFLHFYLD